MIAVTFVCKWMTWTQASPNCFDTGGTDRNVDVHQSENPRVWHFEEPLREFKPKR
jgi:hypothetical protein